MTLQEISRQDGRATSRDYLHIQRVGLKVVDWAIERLENSDRIAKTKTGDDQRSWLEDRAYWRAIVDRLERYDALLASLVIPHEQEKKEDHGAGLIHQTIPDMAGTEPRPNFEGFRQLLANEAENLGVELKHARDGETTAHSADWWAGAVRATQAAIEAWDERFGNTSPPETT
jgi:hypothetical protein